MTYRFQSTSVVTGAGNAITLALGDTLVVAPGVNVVTTNESYAGIKAVGDATIQVYGMVAGPQGILSTASSGFFDLYIAPLGIVSNVYSSGIDTNEEFGIRNYGTIEGEVVTSGQGRIFNYGTLKYYFDGSTSTSDFVEFYNYGTVGGGSYGLFTVPWAFYGSTSQETIFNYGIMNGAIQTSSKTNFYNFGVINTEDWGIYLGGLSNNTFVNEGDIFGDVTFYGGAGANSGVIHGKITLGSGTFDSSSGYVYGSILAGGGYVVGAINGGTVTGGNAHDVMVANQTQASADLHATTTLSAKGGINALYGGGAFNVFMAGDSNGGYNQIWGGASQMSDVSGYANNTLSFANAVGGVYVDILNGHNAYVSAAGGNWVGVGTYEDSIINVPNIIGSRFADVIQADNGVGRITGGGGADQLYAGGVASQDTFVFNAYSDSNVLTGYDTIVGFKRGIDKIDLSAFSTNGSHLALSTSGTSNTVYLEKVAGVFDASTDLAMIVNTTTPGGLQASDFIL